MISRPEIASGADDIEPAAGTSRFVEAGGRRLHYLDYGSGGRPTILCLHGSAANAHWYDFVAGAFNSNYRVIALDARGHGDSDWAVPPAYNFVDYACELEEVVHKLDLRDFVLIGHSMGGRTALAYASTYPQRVAKLVVVDSRLMMSGDRLPEMVESGTRPGRSYGTREEFIARFSLRPKGTVATPEAIRHLALLSCRQMPDGSWRHKFDRNIYYRQKVIDNWEGIRTPALLMKAALSERITPRIAAKVKARCPHVEQIEIPHSYHHITLDNPHAFSAAVKAFLACNSK